jgi:hypothetical protein
MASFSLADRIRRRLRWHVSQPFDRHVRAPLRRLRNAGRDLTPVFVAGASGSGTSLLALSLGQRFEFAGVVYESNLEVAERSFLYVPLIEAFATPADYQRHMSPGPEWSVLQGRRDLLDCYRSHCDGPGRFVVDKGPDIHLLRAAFLHRCFPEAHFLLIFRDPIANVEGLRRKWPTFGRAPLDATIDFYRTCHERFLDDAVAFPERVVMIEYERLVEDVDAALDALGRRLGLVPARAVRKLLTKPNVEGQGIRNVRKNEIGVVTDANRRSRERLGPGDAERIEAALTPLLTRLRGAARPAP